MKNLLVFLIVSLLAAACAGAPEKVAVPAPPEAEIADADAARVTVWFATDRNLTGKTDPAEKFGPARADSLTFGKCEVLLPIGQDKEKPDRSPYWKLEKSGETWSGPKLAATSLVPDAEFLSGFSSLIKRGEKKVVLVFVHGYNVEFGEAAASAAKLAYRLSFTGPVAFFSWPSKGSPSEYFADEATVEWSTPNVRKFLEIVLESTGAENVYLVAHSMGNRALTRAVIALTAGSPRLAGKIKEVILAAPDIDKGVFKRDIGPSLVKAGLPVTLYAAADDRALALSQKVHSFPRAGDAGEGLVVMGGVDTIDCSNAGGGFFNHSYITEDASVLADIAHLLRHSARAEKRPGLSSARAPEGRYWKIAK